MPWSPRTPQQLGSQTEQEVVTRRGGRVHPRSGAGSIKDDGSSETEQIEVKDANRTYTLKGTELDALLKRAISRDKDATFVVYFREANLTATINVTRGKG